MADEKEERFACPRRSESLVGKPGETFPDVWNDGKTCSYCGSLRPDVFFDRALDGEVQLTPTDKSYKVYVGNAKFYFKHFSKEDCERFVDALNAGKFKLAFPGHFYVLPYFCKPVMVKPKSEAEPA